ncbi:MAG: Tagatose-6-phosphate kinase [bacterium]|nr:Tagatose-6-phosphate kinase [bacterium]
MIHTITLNPSIDLTVRVNRLQHGEAHQLAEPLEDAGGKGMNVARALHQLGVPVTSWAFLGGVRGKRWLDLAGREDIPIEVVELAGETRQNIKIFEEAQRHQTDLNFAGLEFEEKACAEFLERLRRKLQPGDTVILAGSTLRGIPFSWWSDLSGVVQSSDSKLIVDMAGPGLIQVAKCNPFLVKINREEFNDWYGLSMVSLNEVFVALQNRESIQSHLVVTDRAAGALLWTTKRRFFRVGALKVEVEGTVGAGDAFLAGLVTAWGEKEGDWENAMRWGIAASAAAVELPGTRFGTRDRVIELVKRVG